MTDVVVRSRYSGLMRAISSLSLACVSAFLLFVTPTYDPLAAMTPEYAVSKCMSVAVGLYLYLLWQAWPLMQGYAESRLSRSGDTFFSLLPALVAITALVMHLGAVQKLSFSMYTYAAAVLAVTLFDVFVFGKIESYFSHLTKDVSVIVTKP